MNEQIYEHKEKNMHEFKTDNKKELVFKNSQALHGDVIIEKISDLPIEFKNMSKEKNDTLAYGEVTGHSHKLFMMTDMPQGGCFDLRVGNDGVRFLKVIESVELRHQEHDPRIIPPGDYVIKIQREYDPFTKLARSVAD
jgi:hypothetical protein